MNIAIVGNGPSLKDASFGDFIDGCDKVIRMNYFRTSGYEKNIGRRCSIYVCGTHIPIEKKGMKIDEWCEDGIWHPWPESPHDEFPFKENIEKYEKWINKYVDLKKISIDYFPDYLYEKLYERDIKCPTTGIRTVLMAIDKFYSIDNNIYVIGMDCVEKGHYWKSEHPMYEGHEFDREAYFLKDLKEEGFIEIK